MRRSNTNEAPKGRLIACAASQRAMSLIEILIVLVLLSVFAATLIPQFEPRVSRQLESVAEIVAADLDYARSLAISNGSRYRIRFDLAGQHYILEHSGENSQLDVLPGSPFQRSGGPSNQHQVEFAVLPRFGPVVELAGVQKVVTVPQAVTAIEFNSLGATTRSEPTVVWLACGPGDARRYFGIEVDPVTGLSSLGELTATRPQGLTR